MELPDPLPPPLPDPLPHPLPDPLPDPLPPRCRRDPCAAEWLSTTLEASFE